jgi:hypothetical protein
MIVHNKHVSVDYFLGVEVKHVGNWPQKQIIEKTLKHDTNHKK